MTEPVSNGVFIPDGPVNMLIIDPQVDFHEGGNLAVPGATADSNRIAKFIENCRTNITRIKINSIKETEATLINQIFVSLDTHTERHIGHPGYWQILDEKITKLEPFTMFRVKDDKIMARLQNRETGETFYDIEVTTVEPTLLKWTKYYIEQMVDSQGKEKTAKGSPLVWPIHCIEATKGHYIHQPLKNVLDSVSNVEYHIKGQCETAEMYSIFKSEIVYKDIENVISVSNISTDKIYHGSYIDKIKPTSKIETPQTGDTIAIDGAYLNTDFNETLFNSITSGSKPILICGQALSHCVNWSLRDLVEKILENKTEGYYNEYTKSLNSDKVILLINASSPVGGFEKNVLNLIKFCKQKNVSIKYLSEDGNILDRKPESYKPPENIQKALTEYFPFGGGKSRRRTRKLNRRQRRRTAKRMVNRRRHRRTRK